MQIFKKLSNMPFENVNSYTKLTKVRISNFLDFVIFVSFVVSSVFHTCYRYTSLPKIAAAVQPKFLP